MRIFFRNLPMPPTWSCHPNSATMLASGKPVIATANPGTQISQVLDTLGILIQPGNAAALAQALIKLSENPSERLRLGNLGCAYACQHLDKEIILSRLNASLMQNIWRLKPDTCHLISKYFSTEDKCPTILKIPSIYAIDFKRLLTTLQRWAWLLILATALGAVFAYVYSRQQTPVYEATTNILVTLNSQQSIGDLSTILESLPARRNLCAHVVPG